MRLPSPRILRAFNRRSVIALSAFALAVAGVSVTASADANANSGVVTTMVVHVPGALPIRVVDRPNWCALSNPLRRAGLLPNPRRDFIHRHSEGACH